jgi:hypothetical protein
MDLGSRVSGVAGAVRPYIAAIAADEKLRSDLRQLTKHALDARRRAQRKRRRRKLQFLSVAAGGVAVGLLYPGTRAWLQKRQSREEQPEPTRGAMNRAGDDLGGKLKEAEGKLTDD